MLSDLENELLSNALAIISEHFPNYAVAVLSEDGGDLHYDYSNWRIGRMLMRDSLDDMGEEGMGEGWSWDDEEDDEDYE